MYYLFFIMITTIITTITTIKNHLFLKTKIFFYVTSIIKHRYN